MLEANGYIGIPMASFADALSSLHGFAFAIVVARIGSGEPYENVFLMEAKLLQPFLKIIAVTSVKYPPPHSMNIDAMLPIPFSIEQLNATVLEALQSSLCIPTPYSTQ